MSRTGSPDKGGGRFRGLMAQDSYGQTQDGRMYGDGTERF